MSIDIKVGARTIYFRDRNEARECLTLLQAAVHVERAERDRRKREGRYVPGGRRVSMYARRIEQ